MPVPRVPDPEPLLCFSVSMCADPARWASSSKCRPESQQLNMAPVPAYILARMSEWLATIGSDTTLTIP